MLGIGVCSDPWTTPILVYVVVLGFCEGPSDGTSLGPPRLCLEGRKLIYGIGGWSGPPGTPPLKWGMQHWGEMSLKQFTCGRGHRDGSDGSWLSLFQELREKDEFSDRK